ncbi:MAG: hypothetical protein ACD_57C00091G0002 [uncultured bacterium]|nr:MAG: hypothetical protein ACD_57C00091G0002 [uncultured bacterium]
MWQVGSIIEVYTEKNKIKPHNLYWQIYGKAEGIKTSYITRDFLSYCLRIKKYFNKSEDITKKFPRLQAYSLFREAFPLLENPKFKLSPDEETRIVNDLNSSATPQKIKKMIVEIKADRIGVKNTRNQKLNEMKPITDAFLAVYNEVYFLIKDNNKLETDALTNSIKKDYLLKLSQAVSALTQENLFVPVLGSRNDLPESWAIFVSDLKKLLNGTVEFRNRFRRLVPPRKLFDLADMLNAFTTEQGLANYRKRKMASLS